MKDGYIDLGKSYDTKAEISVPEKNRVSYPTMYVSHDMKDDSGLDELPDGEFEFTAKGRVISYKEDMKNKTCSCEIEVIGIKPSTKKAKKAKSSEESLDTALDDVIAKKTKK